MICLFELVSVFVSEATDSMLTQIHLGATSIYIPCFICRNKITKNCLLASLNAVFVSLRCKIIVEIERIKFQNNFKKKICVAVFLTSFISLKR